MNPAILDAAVLEILSDHGTPSPERYVMLALTVEYRIKTSYTELRECLRKLEETKHIVSIRSSDSIVVWSISDLGRTVLLELHL